MSPTFTSLKGINRLDETSFSEAVEANVISFFDWGFIDRGGYQNVTIDQSGHYGGNESILRPVTDERFETAQSWESFRGNWVWESGMAVGPEINLSGVYIDDTFHPLSGVDFYVDYYNGRVVFESGIPATSEVQAEYSYKWVDWRSADTLPILNHIQQHSFRVDDDRFFQGSGIWGELKETRVQLPTVGVQVIKDNFRGWQIGGGQWVDFRVKFYIVTEDDSSCKKISDTIASQNHKTIRMYDMDRLAIDNAYPISMNGSLNDNPMTYPEIVTNMGYIYSGVSGGLLYFHDATQQDVQRLNQDVCYTVVTMNAELAAHSI